MARHTFATTVTLSNGVPIETVSKMLGHTTIRTTQIYAKVVEQKISTDMNVLRDKLKPTPKIKGLELKINGGRVQSNVRDTTIQVFDLIPYTSYLVELNPNSFDNIAWQLKKSLFKVTIDPNKVKLLEIPVKVSGEASGMVYGCSRDSIGQDRIVVDFYQGSRLVGKTITESDGDFSFLGLLPGAYTACVDPEQLNKLKMRAFPSSVPFKVKVKTDGDVVSNINFKLER